MKIGYKIILLSALTIFLPATGEECNTSYIVASDLGSRKDMKITRDDLVNAIITVESSWKHKAVGRSFERGLMQVTYRTWQEVTKKMLRVNWPWSSAFDPERNVIVGSAYLDYLMERFKNSPTQMWDAVRAYNKGYSGAKKGQGWYYLRKVRKALERR